MALAEIVVLLALGLDTLALAISLGLAGIPIAALAYLGVQSFLLGVVGMTIGEKLGERLGQRAKRCSKATFVGIGLAIVFSQMPGLDSGA